MIGESDTKALLIALEKWALLVRNNGMRRMQVPSQFPNSEALSLIGEHNHRTLTALNGQGNCGLEIVGKELQRAFNRPRRIPGQNK